MQYADFVAPNQLFQKYRYICLLALIDIAHANFLSISVVLLVYTLLGIAASFEQQYCKDFLWKNIWKVQKQRYHTYRESDVCHFQESEMPQLLFLL